VIKFYTNQELSRRFDIKLSRWKRWSREFLPPDPLGGLQSGYARQYNLDQAFTVYLGGYLVGELRFTIPEARLILKDLHHWLVEKRFYFNFSARAPASAGVENCPDVQYYQIAICRTADGGTSDSWFLYSIKRVIADEWIDANGNWVHQKQSVEETVHSAAGNTSIDAMAGYRVLNISVLHHIFLSALGRDHSA
jgi:hypothetical protein